MSNTVTLLVCYQTKNHISSDLAYKRIRKHLFNAQIESIRGSDVAHLRLRMLMPVR